MKLSYGFLSHFSKYLDYMYWDLSSFYHISRKNHEFYHCIQDCVLRADHISQMSIKSQTLNMFENFISQEVHYSNIKLKHLSIDCRNKVPNKAYEKLTAKNAVKEEFRKNYTQLQNEKREYLITT